MSEDSLLPQWNLVLSRAGNADDSDPPTQRHQTPTHQPGPANGSGKSVSPLPNLPQAAIAGYRHSPPVERATFLMATSFTLTVAASRTVNYFREQRRTLPAVRSVGRKMAQAPSSNSPRIHHFVPGAAIGFATGAVAIMRGADNLQSWLSLPFGVGLALTTDEVRLLVGRNNPYWSGQRYVFAQAAAGALTAAGQLALFVRRGRRLSLETPKRPAVAAIGPRARLRRPRQ